MSQSPPAHPRATFTPPEQRDRRLRDLGATVIGHSEAGREILGLLLGCGPRRASLIAGNHSDEPVGPEALLHLAESADIHPPDGWQWVIIPHVNPDGEAANRPWIERWPDPLAYLAHAFREPPGRDVEFGYPRNRYDDALRLENRAVADFLANHRPYDLHLSLHGMAAATGAMLLIERNWIQRTADLQRDYLQALREAGLEPFDWDRGGEKGFEYIGPGFQTTPRSEPMREHFLARNDPDTAAGFRNSSMQYVQTLGGDPLCLVTELPLFVIDHPDITDAPGQPRRFQTFRRHLPEVKAAVQRGDLDAVSAQLDGFTIEPFALDQAIRLQTKAIELGMRAVEHHLGAAAPR